MINKKRVVPQLRFRGFTDDWEQRKLGEIAIRVRGNDGRMNLPTLTISAGNGWMDQRDRFSQNIAGKEQKNYTLLRQGELSYNHGNSKLAQFGAVFELESYNEALVPRVYHSFSVTADAQPKFIEQMFATHRPDRELRKLVSSGARMDGLLNINYDDFMGIKVWLPSMAEQQAIAGLLVKLDNTIALHQRKHELLLKLKQAYLQKLFPKYGNKIPELRFAGFTDDWEQRKASNIFKSVSTKGYSQLPVLSASQEDGMVLRDNIGIDIKYDQKSLAGYKLVRPGQFVIHLRSFQGGFAYSTIEGITSPAYTIIDFLDKSQNIPEFWKELLKSTSFIASLVTVTYGIRDGRSISFSDFGNLKLNYPSAKEQKRIAEFLQILERAIALHQERLDQLKQLKKAYLQKLFV
ncbi:restriction endonuclease subunit S [Lacticaseibacillus suilingensis]|uniref:Restriction endonuclease subunit S n=2 Tax=Lacticaseibacillus suilingensis TaxID=2799577 RepID=A0ABW4BLY2_9LACO|nr:restriction endonuclease subunit S [Lacticaseibacillus suilingensis]